MSFTVTVRDNETGETQSKEVPDNDYFVLATGTCYVADIQTYPAKGTHVLTIKGRKQPSNGKGA